RARSRRTGPADRPRPPGRLGPIPVGGQPRVTTGTRRGMLSATAHPAGGGVDVPPIAGRAWREGEPMAIGTTLRRTMTATVGLSAAAMMVVACTSATDSAGSGTDEATGLINVGDDPGEPKSGGTLAYAQYSMITDVDPAGREEGGSQGGSELAAVYDLLMRYDPETDEYVPQLAEDLTTDDDVHWTLSLREGVTFSDDTPVDADAVLWSIERYLDKGGSHGQAWRATVESIEATDDHTIEI